MAECVKILGEFDTKVGEEETTVFESRVRLSSLRTTSVSSPERLGSKRLPW
jgi:hypothetical protein